MDDVLRDDLDAISGIEVIPKILETVSQMTGMGFAAIARVTEQRWMACAVYDGIQFGLQPGGELELETTLCNEVRCTDKLIAIDHVDEDPAYANHHTPRQYGFQSYISVPIRLPGGSFFGTLCAIHPSPVPVNNPRTIAMVTLFADLIGFHLDAQERLAESDAALAESHRRDAFRDQFIAILGHDLRNPLAAIDAGTNLLERQQGQSEENRSIFLQMRQSVRRMADLISNVMDFARGALGDGIPVSLQNMSSLGRELEQVVAESRNAHPGVEILSSIEIAEPVRCDPVRLSQITSNLLGNAITHGDSTKPVTLTAWTGRGYLYLTVANAGDPIPEAAAERMFQPFSHDSDSDKGLGLGLFISQQIARAHNGEVTFTSDEHETCFTLRMPVK